MIKKIIKYLQQLFALCYPRNIIGKIDNSNVVGGVDNMEELTVFDVANFFRSKEALTQKKLQKLTYYAYVQYILEYNTADDISNVLFEEVPEAWMHGPVFPSLYQEYKKYNWKKIPKKVRVPKLENSIEKLLNRVWEKYGNFSADELEYMTHCEVPWQKARKKIDASMPSRQKIMPYSIYHYYINR